MTIIDLSVEVNGKTPVYPGDPTTHIQPAGVMARDGYCTHTLSFGTHIGTHIDAPMHMLEHGLPLDAFSIDRFIGRGHYVEVVNGSFDAARDLDLQAGNIVVFDTGMSEHFFEPVYFENYPVMSTEIATYLVAQGVSMVGLDTCSADIQKGFPVHKILLGSNVLIIENLSNLKQLVGKEFEVYALPIKLSLDGAPARVVATVR